MKNFCRRKENKAACSDIADNDIKFSGDTQTVEL